MFGLGNIDGEAARHIFARPKSYLTCARIPFHPLSPSRPSIGSMRDIAYGAPPLDYLSPRPATEMLSKHFPLGTRHSALGAPTNGSSERVRRSANWGPMNPDPPRQARGQIRRSQRAYRRLITALRGFERGVTGEGEEIRRLRAGRTSHPGAA
jgi:hypothetical protein